MPREKRSFEKSARMNPNTFITYVRKGEEEDLAMFDRLILQDPYLVKLKKEGNLSSSRGFRSVMIMRMVRIYNKTHTYREEEMGEEKKEEIEEKQGVVENGT